MGRVAISGGTVRKRLGDRSAVDTLLSRTEILRRAGVATPPARSTGRPGEVSFDLIDGRGGLEVLTGEGDTALGAMIAALMPLHAAKLDDLSVFDPLRRIRPRLATAAVPWIGDWIDRYQPSPSGGGIVHGDFHVGQLIQDPDGGFWVLDLDDLALGPREVDLGNFAAHLATRPETRRGNAIDGFQDWLAIVLGHSPGADLWLAERYGRLALLRRALKLAEQGDETVLADLRRE